MIAALGRIARTIGLGAMLGDVVGIVALCAAIWVGFVVAGCL